MSRAARMSDGTAMDGPRIESHVCGTIDAAASRVDKIADRLVRLDEQIADKITQIGGGPVEAMKMPPAVNDATRAKPAALEQLMMRLGAIECALDRLENTAGRL